MHIPNFSSTEEYLSNFGWSIRPLAPASTVDSRQHRFEVVNADGDVHERYWSLQEVWEEWLEFGKAIVSVEAQVRDFIELFASASAESRDQVLDHLADYFEMGCEGFLDGFLDEREILEASDLPQNWSVQVAEHLRAHGRLLDFYDLVEPALIAEDAATFNRWRARRGWRQAR